MTIHQEKQIEVIHQIEKDIENNTIAFSTVEPVEDFENDPRMCLTYVHFPHQKLLLYIQDAVIRPLKEIDPQHYYYPSDSLHMTIKNIRIINNPPHFSKHDITKAQNILEEIIPLHEKFYVYFYRLLLFP